MGAVPTTGWNVSAVNWSQLRRQRRAHPSQATEALEAMKHTANATKRSPNPADSLRILFEKESGLILLFSAVLFAGFYGIIGAIPSQFALIYGFNEVEIGLCYIPVGIGAMSSAVIQGRLVDWNFRRHATRLGMPLTKGRQPALKDFPIERARLEVALPMVHLTCCLLIGYGWAIGSNAPLAAPRVLLSLVAFTLTGSFTVLSALIVALHPGKAGAATAANNLPRCLRFTAAVLPMIDRMGRGWTYTFMSCDSLLLSPLLFAVMKWGPAWREARRIRDEGANAHADEEASGMSTPAAAEERVGEGMSGESGCNGTPKKSSEERTVDEVGSGGCTGQHRYPLK